MANIKSQKKRALTNQKKYEANKSQKTEVKSAIKAVLAAVDANDKEAAVKALSKANSTLDKARASHVKHENYVARQKSRLALAVNKLG
ncbi:MAG: 30S ribosomal protein S20 [Erysipelotrichaceae bacterium]|nr:30S ribosomal protein S20 [Erysipelotrichaceae bacterium]